MRTETPQIVRLEDYRPSDFLIDRVELDIRLHPTETRILATLAIRPNPKGRKEAPLELDGDELRLVALSVDGRAASAADYAATPQSLTIPRPPARPFTLTIETAVNPSANTKLMGLYRSGGVYCTQCEAEGFRRITYFLDRPDVLAVYTTRLEGDRDTEPLLLGNGNPVEAGGVAGTNRHYAVWHDPFPKPSYLFAIVGGALGTVAKTFTTTSGRNVEIAVHVEPGKESRADYALDALERAMRWDEETFGREYDLDVFNVVAVSDFNMGAMENKSLNIFNSAYVLADQETATDGDFDNIARVVAHEYFHNWSGDRVTCRDWFQLSLKEGFTVFRDQSFSADVGSPAVKRIEDVRVLRAAQFPEDAGPLAHPVRPDSFIEISNFYTATVYNKGAELIRMFHTVLGPEKFRAGTDLYFERHDGEAATCDEFVKALEDASGVDLSAFKIWYSQAGTPKVRARIDYDAEARTATLHLDQHIEPTPGQPTKQPMPIPLRTALIGGTSGHEICPERLVLLQEAHQSVRFENVVEPPLLSINRNFSAPVIVRAERHAHELERLAQADTDPFARYEAMQELLMAALVAGASGERTDPEPVIRAIAETLKSNSLDAAFKGEAILLPSEGLVADRMDVVDPDAIHTARESLRNAIGSALAEPLLAAHRSDGASGDDLSPAAKGIRRLRTVALGLIAAGDDRRGAELAKAQFDRADNMTDRQGALGILVSLDAPERQAALNAFYDRFREDPLVIDKWFALQSAAQRADTVEQVLRLAAHPDFVVTNPNRLRALAGTFGANHWAFHSADGRGYAFLADMILAADKLNPQVAARLVPPFGRWRRFELKRAEMMRQALERIVAAPELSKDVFEQVSKSLA
ncbi:MAG: aminopeptidase N [Microvirga sp.]